MNVNTRLVSLHQTFSLCHELHAATKHTVQKSNTGVGVASWGSIIQLWHHWCVRVDIFKHHSLHFVRVCLPGCRGHIVLLSCNLNWNHLSSSISLKQKLAVVKTPLETTIYLASNQARCVISTEYHWVAAIICRLISLERNSHYTVQNMSNNGLFVLHKGSPKLWHGVKDLSCIFCFISHVVIRH